METSKGKATSNLRYPLPVQEGKVEVLKVSASGSVSGRFFVLYCLVVGCNSISLVLATVVGLFVTSSLRVDPSYPISYFV